LPSTVAKDTIQREATFRRVLTRLDGDGLDGAVSGYVTDVLAGAAPAPVLPTVAGPVEREQRRAVSREVTHPVPDGLLPAAAADGKLLRGSVTTDGRTFLVAAIDHTTGTVLGSGRSRTNAARTPPWSRCCPVWTPARCGPWTLCTRVRRPLG